jgi:glycosyltransferase involved in cell wall biosynthesis
MKPLVSILIPAYNAEEWIADTIKSALAQTWPNKEIIVVDDGSTDQTLSVARQFASETISLVTQENQGAAAARNRAFALCRGDLIQWLDADDLLAPDKIATQIEAFNSGASKRTLFSGPWAYFMYRPEKARFIPTALWSDLSPCEWLLRKWEHNAHMQTATWLVRRELTEAAGPWDTRLLGDDDGEYFFRVVRASDGIRFVPDARVFYRISGSSRLSYIGWSDKKMEAQFLGMQLQIGYLRSMDDSERTRAACVNYLQTWLPNFYPDRPDIVEQAQQHAAALGGKVHPPRLSWKYAWIRWIAGWRAAKWVQHHYNQFKLSLLRSWDKMLFRFDKQRSVDHCRT